MKNCSRVEMPLRWEYSRFGFNGFCGRRTCGENGQVDERRNLLVLLLVFCGLAASLTIAGLNNWYQRGTTRINR
jgi:hypothetical protein